MIIKRAETRRERSRWRDADADADEEEMKILTKRWDDYLFVSIVAVAVTQSFIMMKDCVKDYYLCFYQLTLNLTHRHVIKHAFIANHLNDEAVIIAKFINDLEKEQYVSN